MCVNPCYLSMGAFVWKLLILSRMLTKGGGYDTCVRLLESAASSATHVAGCCLSAQPGAVCSASHFAAAAQTVFVLVNPLRALLLHNTSIWISLLFLLLPTLLLLHLLLFLCFRRPMFGPLWWSRFTCCLSCCLFCCCCKMLLLSL